MASEREERGSVGRAQAPPRWCQGLFPLAEWPEPGCLLAMLHRTLHMHIFQVVFCN